MISNKEINSEMELFVFLNQISECGIKIPKNLTFEFDSYEMQNYYNTMAKHYLPFALNNNIERFELMGFKISIKQNTQQTKIEHYKVTNGIFENSSTNTAEGIYVKNLKIKGLNDAKE